MARIPGREKRYPKLVKQVLLVPAGSLLMVLLVSGVSKHWREVPPLPPHPSPTPPSTSHTTPAPTPTPHPKPAPSPHHHTPTSAPHKPNPTPTPVPSHHPQPKPIPHPTPVPAPKPHPPSPRPSQAPTPPPIHHKHRPSHAPTPAPSPSHAPTPTPGRAPTPSPGQEAQELRRELARLRRQWGEERSSTRSWSRQVEEVKEEIAKVEKEIKPARERWKKANSDEHVADERREALLTKREALRKGDPGTPGGILDRQPLQWPLALLAAACGLVGLLGSEAIFRFFQAVIGSAVGGLLLVLSVSYFTSSGGGVVDPMACIAYSDRCWFDRWFWAFLLLLGILRWVMGFECALYAVVDEVAMDESSSGRYLVNIQKDKHGGELSGDEDEVDDEGMATYLLDNSVLQSKAKFIAYRFTKRLEDKDEDHPLAAYGEYVKGHDEGDGWLRVGRRYLPMQVRGVPVLILQTRQESMTTNAGDYLTATNAAESAPSSSQEGPATFEEFEKTAIEICEGPPPSRADLQRMWEQAGRELGGAVDLLLHRNDGGRG